MLSLNKSVTCALDNSKYISVYFSPRGQDEEGEGVKNVCYFPRSWYKNCPRRGSVKKWQNYVPVLVECPQRPKVSPISPKKQHLEFFEDKILPIRKEQELYIYIASNDFWAKKVGTLIIFFTMKKSVLSYFAMKDKRVHKPLFVV